MFTNLNWFLSRRRLKAINLIFSTTFHWSIFSQLFVVIRHWSKKKEENLTFPLFKFNADILCSFSQTNIFGSIINKNLPFLNIINCRFVEIIYRKNSTAKSVLLEQVIFLNNHHDTGINNAITQQQQQHCLVCGDDDGLSIE
jgi:hypothetical protein